MRVKGGGQVEGEVEREMSVGHLWQKVYKRGRGRGAPVLQALPTPTLRELVGRLFVSSIIFCPLPHPHLPCNHAYPSTHTHTPPLHHARRHPAQKWEIAAACFQHLELVLELAARSTTPPGATPAARQPPGYMVLHDILGKWGGACWVSGGSMLGERGEGGGWFGGGQRAASPGVTPAARQPSSQAELHNYAGLGAATGCWGSGGGGEGNARPHPFSPTAVSLCSPLSPLPSPLLQGVVPPFRHSCTSCYLAIRTSPQCSLCSCWQAEEEEELWEGPLMASAMGELGCSCCSRGVSEAEAVQVAPLAAAVHSYCPEAEAVLLRSRRTPW